MSPRIPAWSQMQIALAIINAFLVAVALILLAGCGQNREMTTDQKRNLRRDTTEVRQVALPDGKIVQLTTRIVTIEKETSAEQQAEQVQVEAPKLLQDLGSTIKAGATAAATALGGPIAGQAAAAGIDWISTLLGAGGAAAVATGTGVVASRRSSARRRELVKAQDAYASDLEDAETDDDVKDLKAKHAERQKALGIYDQLTKERHGA